MQEGQEMQI